MAAHYWRDSGPGSIPGVQFFYVCGVVLHAAVLVKRPGKHQGICRFDSYRANELGTRFGPCSRFKLRLG